MALILVVGVAYTAYASQEHKFELDPDIELDGKESVELLPLEQTLSLLEAPLATISFFEGDYVAASEFLRMRVADIVYRNPWLGGWILQMQGDKAIKLYFDPSSDDVAPGIFHMYEPGEIALSYDDHDHVDYDRIAHPAKVNDNKYLVGKNLPIWKVSIIPDAVTPNKRFALVVSMSHVGGDAHTFYQIYNMLYRGAPILPLNPRRKLYVSGHVATRMGVQEAYYVKHAVHKPLWRQLSSTSEHGADKLQTRQVYVSSKWLEDRLEQLQEGPDSDVEVLRVTPFSVVSSWFFQLVQPTVGLVGYSIRNQLANCDLDDLDAGNYQNPIPVTELDYATPQLIEQALRTGRRCGSDPPTPLPGFSRNATFSISIDWAQHFERGLDLGDKVAKEMQHLPLYNVDKLNEQNSKLSFICLYTANPASEGSPSRMGAMIVAPQSMMETIVASEFVGGVIV